MNLYLTNFHQILSKMNLSYWYPWDISWLWHLVVIITNIALIFLRLMKRYVVFRSKYLPVLMFLHALAPIPLAFSFVQCVHFSDEQVRVQIFSVGLLPWIMRLPTGKDSICSLTISRSSVIIIIVILYFMRVNQLSQLHESSLRPSDYTKENMILHYITIIQIKHNTKQIH